MPAKLIIQDGQVFGRWTVIKEANPRRLPSKQKVRFFLCKCQCGTEREVRLVHLVTGASHSCGCYCMERIKECNSTHGKSKHSLYNVWSGMNSRCANKNDPNYHYYGGRGISVCREWSSSIEAFIEWATQNGWETGLDIDRINNDGNYCPENCRFITHKKNSRNRGNNHKLTHDGKTLTIAEWAETTGLKYATISSRIRNGWTHEMALTEPPKHGGRWAQGKTK